MVVDGVADQSITNFGYDYIVPLGARYAAPVAILAVVGFAILAYSFALNESRSRERRRIRMLGIIAGIMVQVAVIAAFVYTTTEAAAAPEGSTSYSVVVSSRYGMLCTGLFGFLIMMAALEYLVTTLKIMGVSSILGGLAFTVMAAYGMGKGDVVYHLNERISSAEEFLFIGAAALVLGIAVAYVSFTRMSD